MTHLHLILLIVTVLGTPAVIVVGAAVAIWRHRALDAEHNLQEAMQEVLKMRRQVRDAQAAVTLTEQANARLAQQVPEMSTR